MASLASINIKFTADLNQFSTQLQSANRDIKKLSTSLSSVGNTLSIGLTLPILAFGAAAVKVYGDIQALQLGLSSVMGSAEAAGDEFKNLREVAKLPGLGLEEAVRGSVNLQAAGFSAEKARGTLLAFGNALATVGKGKNELNLVILALTQLQNKSGGFAQDLRQLTEQLPQLRGALTNAFGTADSEAIQKTGVTGRQIVEMLTKEFSKLPKVSGGIKNAFENISDSVTLALAKVGESINNNFDIEGKLSALSELLSDLADRFSELSPVTQSVIFTIAGLAAAIGPLMLAIGGLVTLAPLVVAGFTAVAASFAFVAANIVPIVAVLTVVTAGFYIFSDSADQANASVIKLSDSQKVIQRVTDEASASIVNQKSKLDTLLLTARNENEEKRERLRAIDAINKISPEYLGNLTLENINTDKARIAIEKYNTALLSGATARAAQSALDNAAADKIKAGFEREKVLAAYNEQRQLAIAKGWQAEKQFYEENNRLMGFANDALERANAKYDFESKILLDIINKNKTNLKLVQETTVALASLGPKPGTIGYFEAQISELKKLQKEIPTTNEAWKSYERQIDSLNAKIKGIENPGVFLNLPKKIPVHEAQPKPVLADYKAELQYLEGVRESISSTAAEYEAASQRINDLQITIKTIEGVDELKESTKEIKDTIVELNKALFDALEGALENAAVGFGELLGSLADGGNALKGIGQLFMTTLADLAIQVGKIAIGFGIALEAIKSSLISFGGIGAIAAGVALIALGSLVKSQIKSAGGFANGGIVGGSSFSGDKLFARVNSGEMILNQKQQRNLSSMINPAGSVIEMGNTISNIALRGEDIFIALERYMKTKNRIS